MADLARLDAKAEKLKELEELRGSVIQGDEDAQRIMRDATEDVDSVLKSDERKKMLTYLSKWRRQREARPEVEERDFPWKGASNVCVPMALTNANTAYALLKSSLAQRKPFWNIESDDPKYRHQALALRAMMDALAESKHHLNLRHQNKTILYDLASLGTQFVKIPWLVRDWYFKKITAGGIEPVHKIAQNSPAIIPVRMEDVLVRPFWDNPQTAPHFTQQIHLFRHELQQRAASGLFDPEGVEKVLSRDPSKIDDARKEQLQRMGISVDESKDTGLYDICEMHRYEDVDGDGIPEDIIMWFDHLTQTYLRTEFNDLGIREWVAIPYFARPYELYGMGTGWMVQGMQDELDALHNMRVDGLMLSMLQMYITRRGSSIAPNETFRPLKQIIADDPTKDFIPVKFPDISPSTVQAELLAKDYGDRAATMSDALMGQESWANRSRNTASGTMFLANKGMNVFDGGILDGVTDAYDEIGQIIGFQLIRNKERAEDLQYLIPEEHWAGFQEVLNMPVEDIPTRFRFRIQTTEAEQTEQAKQQMMLTKVQVYQMYAQQVIPLAAQLYNPQVQQQMPPPLKEMMTKIFVGSTKMMSDVLEQMGTDDPNKYVPYIKDLELMMQMLEQQKDQQLAQIKGGMNGVPQNNQTMGPGAEPSGAPGAAGGGAGMGLPG